MEMIYMFKNNSVLLLLCSVFIIQVSGCSTQHARVFVDNTACAKSLADGVIETIVEDWDAETMDMAESIKVKDTLGRYLYAKTFGNEFNTISISSKGTQYSYLFQKKDNSCWLRLYKKESKNSSYTNTMTFINSQKIEKCKCGKNDMGIQVGL
jgi:hypothetical protein